MVLVAFPDVELSAFLVGTREEAIESIRTLPEHTGKVYLFKLAFYRGRVYAKRQHKID